MFCLSPNVEAVGYNQFATNLVGAGAVSGDRHFADLEYATQQCRRCPATASPPIFPFDKPVRLRL